MRTASSSRWSPSTWRRARRSWCRWRDARVEAAEAKPAAKQGLAAIVEMVLEMQKDIPPEEWDNLPTDLAKNKKHYLYGHPKEED